MFFVSLHKYYPTLTKTGANSSGQIYDVPMQLSPYFLKKDETTSETREITINDSLQIVSLNSSLMPAYIQLKDVLFFGRQNCGYINRDIKHFISPYLTRGGNDIEYSIPRTKGNVAAIPNIIFLQDTDGNDYVAMGNKFNWTNGTMTPTYVLVTEGGVTGSNQWNPNYITYYNNQFYKDLIAKIDELTTKYAGDTMYYKYFFPLTDGNVLIAPYNGHTNDLSRNAIAIVTGSTKPLKESIMTKNEWRTILEERGKPSGDSNYPYKTFDFYPYLMRHAKKYNTYDKSKYFIGLSHCGKFELYDKSIQNEIPLFPITTLPLHKLGLLMAVNTNVSDGLITFPLSNLCHNSVLDKIDGTVRFNFTLWNGWNNRSVRNRWDFRQTVDSNTYSGYMGGAFSTTSGPTILSAMVDDTTGKINIYSLIVNGGSWWSAYLNFYIHAVLKDAEIYRTPKNKDYNYFELNEIPLDFYKDVGVGAYNNNLVTGSSTSWNSTSYDWIYFVDINTNISVLQKGFEGKTMLTDSEEFKTLSGAASSTDATEYLTCYGFRDWEIINNLYTGRNSSKFDTRTDSNFASGGYSNITIPQIYLNRNKTTIAEVFNERNDNIMVDGIFDHFNDIFAEALIYIVDTKVLGVYGLSSPEYHKFMPNCCIWFEVDDLYTYTTDGKISGYNTKYVNADGTFVYDLSQFTKFKARYFEHTKEILWDTHIANNTDFAMRLDSQTKIYLSDLNAISEFYVSMWKPYQTAIKRIEIKLNTTTSGGTV